MKAGAVVALLISLVLPSVALAAISPAPFSRPLGVGSTGQDVTVLQQFLVRQGFLKVTLTGYYGALTAAAVAKLQAANKLEPVGAVGPKTLLLINAVLKSQAAPASSALSGWPDASNTGVPSGVVLTPARNATLPLGVALDASGNMTITSPGVTINGLDISGTVYVTASNVTIKNSRVRGADWFLITTGNNATNLTVTDSTLDGTGANNSGQTCVVATTILRNNMFHCENGATAGDTAGRVSLIQDNYIHDLLASGSPHYDGVQEGGPSSNETINHNTIDMGNLGETGAVNLSNDFGSISNDVISNNRLLGGSYTVYVDNSRVGTITGIKITNNRLKSGQFGYWAVGAGTTAAKCGNVDDTSGAALDALCAGM